MIAPTNCFEHHEVTIFLTASQRNKLKQQLCFLWCFVQRLHWYPRLQLRTQFWSKCLAWATIDNVLVQPAEMAWLHHISPYSKTHYTSYIKVKPSWELKTIQCGYLLSGNIWLILSNPYCTSTCSTMPLMAINWS